MLHRQWRQDSHDGELARGGCTSNMDHKPKHEDTDIPLVSVMMPAYNCEKYVGEAIESIISQTYTSWELICVDDGSADRTLKIMQEYAAKDPRNRVYTNEENRGRPYTRNKGINLAQGAIIAVQDADDVSLPHRLEEGVETLTTDPDIALVGAGSIEIDEKGEEIGRFVPPLLTESLDAILARHSVPFGHGSVLVKAGAVRAVGGYDEFFSVADDYDLYVRMAQRFEFKAVVGPWYKYRMYLAQPTTSQRQTQTLENMVAYRRAQALATGDTFDLEGEFSRLRVKAAKDLRPEKQEAFGLYQLGIRYLRYGKEGKARRSFWQAVRRSPWSFRAWVGCIVTLIPTTVRRLLIQIYDSAKQNR